jgi:hypothetical protein
MPKGGRKTTSFRPGQSGNPLGRPRNSDLVGPSKTRADVRELAKSYAPGAIETLKKVMDDPKAPPAARVGAATAILDRGWGKPTQPVDANVNFFEALPDHEQRALLAALTALQAEEEDKPALTN